MSRLLGRSAGVAALVLSAAVTRAAWLEPKDWSIAGPGGVEVTQATDNNLDTAWSSRTPQREGLGITIDLGKPAVIHRVYLNPGRTDSGFPRSLRILAGPDAEHLTPVHEALLLADRETNLKFDPAVGRIWRLEIGKEACAQPWSIAELELYGSYDPAAWPARDAVVVDPKAAEPLQCAARELRYYIGELTGRPLPLVAPDRTNAYPGTLYTVVDLAPLARTSDELEANRKAGRIPTNVVNVVREGRAVLYRAWPYANVLNSVWEFLERQGVRWVYPDEQGDFVPAGRGVRLDILPLTYTPPSDLRFANFGVGEFGTTPNSDQHLYWWRSRWNYTWGGWQTCVLGGTERPKPDPERAAQVSRGPLDGYPHDFATVVPEEVLRQHPAWCGMYRGIMNKEIKPDSPLFGKRLSPGQGGPTFCMSNPELAEWVAQKIVAAAKGSPDAEGTYWLCPMDAARYCECEACMRWIEPVEVDNMIFEFGGWASASDVYYHFVSEVARQVLKTSPKVRIGALAYSTCHRPPRKLDRLPDNVLVHVGLYGAMNLPLSHPQNAEMRRRLEQWSRIAPHLGYYSWALIHSESLNKTPAPLVTASADWMRALDGAHALSGGSQASEGLLQFNPWNFYAYPHLAWKPDTPPATLLGDFFSGFYREAADPMLAYYRTLENHLLAAGVNLHMGNYGYGPKPEAFPPGVRKGMEQSLAQAETSATRWVVKERIRTAREGYAWTVTQVARQTAGPEDAAKGGKVTYPCYRRTGAIQIDGTLDDAAWQACPAATGFTTPRTGLPAILRQTEFRMTWDDTNLYVAVRCQEPDAASMQGAAGDPYFSDSVELFFAPARGTPTPYYRLALAFDGRHQGPTLFLGSMHNAQGGEPVPCQTAAAAGDGSWSVEAAIPFRALGGAPKAGTAWYANVCRNVRVAGGLAENCTTWSALPVLNWHFYDEYNSIAFQQEALTPAQARAIDDRQNGAFRARHAAWLQRYTQNQDVLKRLPGMRNLAVNAKDATAANAARATASSGLWAERLTGESGGWMIYNNSPQCCEIAWPKPVALDTVVVRFSGQYQRVTAYGLEYFDGASWHALADEQDNVLSTGVVRTAKPVPASRLRLYVYQPFGGYRMVDRLEAYELGSTP